MVYYTKNEVNYLQFEIFKNSNITHAVFTRAGGISPSPYNKLNFGSTVGDDQKNVDENRRRGFEAMGREYDSMYDSWLVHERTTLIANKPEIASIQAPRLGDIILTDKPNVTLLMRFADCVPILLHDPVKKVVGLVHAGWRGTLMRVAATAVESMQESFGSVAKHIVAAIGPSIGVHHYQVGQEVVDEVKHTFGSRGVDHLKQINGHSHFDLWSSNIQILNDVGVTHIENPEICTACDLKKWFSHRAEQSNTGRFGVLLGLNQQ